MGAILDDFEIMKCEALFNASGGKEALQDLIKDFKYYGVITTKTEVDEECSLFTIYIRVPGRSELTIEISKNHCVEAADIRLARYIKDKVIKYMNTGDKYDGTIVVKAAIDYDRFWKLEDADKALEEYESKNGEKQ